MKYEQLDMPPPQVELPFPRRVLCDELMKWNPLTDFKNTLLGDRYICKGGSLGIIGQTGLGKSSLAMQAAVLWAYGKDLFGIKPTRPLKSVIVQAENDDGDLAEVLQGVAKKLLKLPKNQYADLDERIFIYTDSRHHGPSFPTLAKELIARHKPDLFFIDPFLTYLGGDMNSQAVVGGFLRNHLQPISEETGVAWVVMHHTAKPSKDPKSRTNWQGAESAYAGGGSAEFANWCRGTILIKAKEEYVYEFECGKRKRRSGLLDENNRPVTSCIIQHAKDGIYWQRGTDKVIAAARELQNDRVNQVVEEMGCKKNTWTQIIEIIKRNFGLKQKAAENFFSDHLRKKLSKTGDDMYVVTPVPHPTPVSTPGGVRNPSTPATPPTLYKGEGGTGVGLARETARITPVKKKVVRA